MVKSCDKPDDEDRAAFREAMDGVEPLEDERATPYHRKRRPVPHDISADDEQGDELHDLVIETGDFLEFRRPGIQNRLFQDLRSFFSPLLILIPPIFLTHLEFDSLYGSVKVPKTFFLDSLRIRVPGQRVAGL